MYEIRIYFLSALRPKSSEEKVPIRGKKDRTVLQIKMTKESLEILSSI